MGGRAAEEVVFGSRTTGAENDMQQATELVRQMVTRWGMSERVGPLAVGSSDPFAQWSSLGSSAVAQSLVDAEVRRIVEKAHAETTALLSAHRAQLDALAEALLEQETLDQPAAYAAAGIAQPGSVGSVLLETP